MYCYSGVAGEVYELNLRIETFGCDLRCGVQSTKEGVCSQKHVVNRFMPEVTG